MQEKKFYSQLEGLRGVAILLVLISHFIIVPNFYSLHFLKLGFWGVNIFFVLSGFLISELLMRDINKKKPTPQILKSFYIRRTLRIFPIYYLTIFLLFIFNIGNTTQVLPYTLTYTYNLANVWAGVFSEPVTHLWSLCVEEQFYLLWPLMLVLLNKKYQLHLILGMILIGLLSRVVYIGMELPNYQNFIWSTPACFDCLGLGALLAWLKLNKEYLLSRILKLYYIPLTLSLLFWILAKLVGNTEESFLFGSFGRFIAGLTGFYLTGLGALGWRTWYGKMMTWNWLRFIGRISYGLYIYHWILYILLYKYLTNWVSENFNSDIFILDKLRYNSYIVSFLVLTAISIIVSFVSYKLIEKPLLNLKERFS